jgi:hypothetical protein
MAAMSSEFRKTVERLAGSADDQEQYLRQLGTAPSADELALEFSDCLMAEKSILGAELRTAAIELEEYLSAMSGPGKHTLWYASALHSSPEWARVRDLAREILRRADGRKNS